MLFAKVFLLCVALCAVCTASTPFVLRRRQASLLDGDSSLHIVKLQSTSNHPHGGSASTSSSFALSADRIAANRKICFENRPLASSRPFHETWQCRSTVPIDEDYSVWPENQIPQALDSKSVMLLDGGDWGKLCNKMGILTGLLFHLKNLRLLPSMVVALTTPFASVLWALDYALFASKVGGVLMDCQYCGPSSATTKWDYFSCVHFISSSGRVYNVSNHVFAKNHSIWVGNMYWGFRFNSLGYDKDLINALRPKPYLQRMVTEYFQSRKSKHTSVSIHRRWIEGLCYPFLADSIQEYLCAKQGTATLFNPLNALMSSASVKEYYTATKRFKEMDDQHRKSYEVLAPVLITCNYTLDQDQFPLINATWPQAFQNKFDLFVGTDGQVPQGDYALQHSPFPSRVHMLSDMDLPTCFGRRKYHDMLTEMYAMSLADFHMELPTSSCSRFVQEWRITLGKPVGSMYPPVCFDGFYKN